MKRAVLVLAILLLPTLVMVFFREIASYLAGTSAAAVVLLPDPAGPGSGQPNLFARPGGPVLLSWIESREGEDTLLFSRWSQGAWQPATTIASGNDWLVNWADFPSLSALDDRQLAAHWLKRTGSDTYDYEVVVWTSDNGGSNWSESLLPHAESKLGEHGFVSLVPNKDHWDLFWLDGRHLVDQAPGKGSMSLRHSTFDVNLLLANSTVLDHRVCECCQTSAGLTEEGLIVAYRDRTEAEIRDISVVRQVEGGWTSPQPVFSDGWQSRSCPVNGPALVSQGKVVAIAWYTQANNEPQVKVSFSRDAGRTFGVPVRIDQGDPLGRVGAILLADGSLVVSWLEEMSGQTRVLLRRIVENGPLKPPLSVAASSSKRAGGFPRLAALGNDLWVAWTDIGPKKEVRTAAVIRAHLIGEGGEPPS